VRTDHYVLWDVQRYQTGRVATTDTEIKAGQCYRLARVQRNPAGNTKQMPAYVVIFDYCEIQPQSNFELLNQYDNDGAVPCSFLFAYSAETAGWTISLARYNTSIAYVL
jgi:hypothetical protein